MKTVKVANIEVPEKIVILNEDFKWNFLRGKPIQLKASATNVFDFKFIDPPSDGAWIYPDEMANEIKYISYEKFLRLKAFL